MTLIRMCIRIRIRIRIAYYVLRITYTCVYWTSATGSGDCEGEVMIHTYGLLWFGRDCRPWTIYVRKVSFSLLS